MPTLFTRWGGKWCRMLTQPLFYLKSCNLAFHLKLNDCKKCLYKGLEVSRQEWATKLLRFMHPLKPFLPHFTITRASWTEWHQIYTRTDLIVNSVRKMQAQVMQMIKVNGSIVFVKLSAWEKIIERKKRASC